MHRNFDAVVVGASFSGLSCASTLAENGLNVLVLERKKEAGQAVHTTGIIVKEAAPALDVPAELTRPIRNVRLYSPSLRHIELASSDYFFLATDTPSVMRFLADRARAKGVQIRYGTAFESGEIRPDGSVFLPDLDIGCTFLVGADGPRSSVAKHFILGINRHFLLGVEAEFSTAELPSGDAFHCFLGQRVARGYLGWVVPGVDVVQVGLATKMPTKPDIDAFIDHVGSSFSLDRKKIAARRGGLIPVGGVVRPLFRANVLLLGDAAGTVSPLSAGGIHTADFYGKQLAGHIVGYVKGATPHPGTLIERDYPAFTFKHLQRLAFEHLMTDWIANRVIGSRVFAMAAKTVFFRKKRL